jgi:hypothetical protein
MQTKRYERSEGIEGELTAVESIEREAIRAGGRRR